MSDLATLGLSFVTTGSQAADQALDNKVTKSAAAQKATEALAASQAKAVSAMREMANAIQAQEAVLMAQARATGQAQAAVQKYASTAEALAATWGRATKAGQDALTMQRAMAAAAATWGQAARSTETRLAGVAGAAGLTAFQMKQIAIQMPDVIQGFAMGQRPMQIFVQQGGQIAQIMGMGPGGFGAGIAAVIGLLGRFLPVIAGVTLAVGAAAAAFMAFKRASDEAAQQARDWDHITTEVNKALDDTEKYARSAAPAVDLLGDAFHRAAAAAKEMAVNTLMARNSELSVAIQKRRESLEAQRQVTAAQIGIASNGMGPGAGEAFIGAATVQAYSALSGPQTDTQLQSQLAQQKAVQDQLAKIMSSPTSAFVDLKALGDSLNSTGSQIQAITEKVNALKDALVHPEQLAKWGMTAKEAAADIAAGQKQIEELRKRQAGRPTRTPRDMTDERTAQIDTGLAQAAQEELQARLALTKDVQSRAVIEKQIAAAQSSIRAAQVARQIADIADDKGLSAAKKAELTGQLQAVKSVYEHVGLLQQQAIDQKTADQLEEQRLQDQRQAGANRLNSLQTEADILQIEQGLSKSAYGRWQIEKQIEEKQYRIEREKAVQELLEASSTDNLSAINDALAKIAALDKAHQLQMPKASDQLFQAFGSAQNSLQGLAQAVQSHDWGSVWSNLASAIETLQKTLLSASASTASKIGAIGGIATALGSAVGGKGGSVLSGIGGGISMGASIGSIIPGIGTVIGGIVGGIGGLISGLFGGGGPSPAEQQRIQAQQQYEEQQRQSARQLEIRLATAEGNSLAALNMQRNDELATMDAANQALAKQVYAAEDAQALADKQRQLNIDLLNAEGKAEEALALQRQADLKALQPELRDLQARVWIAQDAAAAEEKAQQIASQRLSLEAQYYTAIGNATQATAVQRQAELAAIDASLRPMQQAVYAAEDWAAAIQKVNDAISNAVSTVDNQISAAQSQADAARQSAQAYRDAATSLLDAMRQLRGGDLSILSPGQKTAQAGNAFNAAFQKALSGDTSALGQLSGLGQDYLTALRGSSSTSAQYAQGFGRVQAMLQQAANAAGIDAGIMDYQSTLLNVQVGVLKDIKDELGKDNPSPDILRQQTDLLSVIRDKLEDQTHNLITINSTLSDQTGKIIVGNAIVSAQTGQIVGITAAAGQSVAQAVYQQTGQTVLGNTILSAQTGQIVAQTGATQQGLSVQDAIRNLAGAQTAYSAQMLQALAQQGTPTATFSAMLQGINNTISVLTDIRSLLGAKSAPPPTVPVPATPSAPQLSAFDQAKAALLAGDRNAAQRYLNANPDIAYRYSHPTPNVGDINPIAGQDILDFALMQFRIAGQFEAFPDHGRNLFAMGGAFTNGIVSRPTAFSVGLMGEAGPEGVLPLTNVGGRLGVYAANDNAAAEEIRRLRSVVERLESRLAKIEDNTGDLKAEAKHQRRFGVYARGTQPGEAVSTQVA